MVHHLLEALAEGTPPDAREALLRLGKETGPTLGAIPNCFTME